MESAADEEPTEFLEPVVDEIVDNVEEVVNDEEMVRVEHEEILEEIVHGDDVMYDTEGRLIEYQNVMVYEDGAEVIEEYVEVEDLGNGDYAYVMTDEHGNRRLLKPDEVDTVKKEVPLLMEDEMIDKSTVGADGEGPSSSNAYPVQKRSRQSHRSEKGHSRQMRDLLRDNLLYSEYYHDNQTKRINDMAKVDVEKYVPSVTVNRRPLPDNADFKPKPQRSRKNPPWQEESSSRGRTTSDSRRESSPTLKDPLFPDDDGAIRFKCPECGQGFTSMERHCDHITKMHDCPATVRELEFFNERDFDNFFLKLERAHQQKEHGSIVLPPKKKSRHGMTQTFVCNYMNKGRSKYSEFVEVGLNALADRPQEFCSAFVQKTHNYECIRVHYCDQHIHYDGNIGFRVPLTVKRRLFEMSFKRIPIPCMQVILCHEAEALVPNPTRFEEKLKNFSHVEIVELLGLIVGSLRKFNEPSFQLQKGKKIPIKFDTVQVNGQDTLLVRRLHPPSKPLPPPQRMQMNGPSTSEMNFALDVPTIGREIELEEEEEDLTEVPDGADGIMDEAFLYDPGNNRDPLIEELTEVELGVLEAYERDILARLTDDQKKERVRTKAKFALDKIIRIYQTLDSATHGISPSDIHNDSIGNLREMASFVVELACQLDAEVKAQFNPSLRVDEIKRDMIAGIALQERTCAPDKRRIKPILPPERERFRPAKTQDEYHERTFVKPNKSSNSHHRPPPPMSSSSNTFDLSAEMKHMEMLRNQHMAQQQQLQEVEAMQEEKPAVMSHPSQSTPWVKVSSRRRQTADPNAPPRKRARQNKKEDPTSSGTQSIRLKAVLDSSAPASGPLEVHQAAPASEDTSRRSEEPQAGEVATASSNVAEGETIPTAQVSTEAPVESSVEPESNPTPAPSEKASTPEGEEEQSVKMEMQSPAKTNGKARDATASRPLFHWPKGQQEKPVDESSAGTPAPPTKTRTGRVVKPKKWGDE